MKTRRSPRKQYRLWRQIGQQLARAAAQTTADNTDPHMPKKYKEFKFSSPFNQTTEIKKAVNEARNADELAEFAGMRISEVARVLSLTTPNAQHALVLLQKAEEKLSDARQALDAAVWNVEKLLK